MIAIEEKTQTDYKTDYNKLVGEHNGEYYFCDYIFSKTLHDKPFKGATGTILVPISKAEYDERMSVENAIERFEDVWIQAVQEHQTTQSLEDFVQDILDMDGEDAVFDLSYIELWDQMRALGFSEKEYPVFECIGAGRCFDADMEFDAIYDAELLQKIRDIETP